MPEWRIPLSNLDYGPEEESAVRAVLESRWLSMGPQVRAFEEEFAAFVGATHAIAVANGTAALHLSYLAMELGPGDEIIQPAINFAAAANMAVAVGAIPVFADIVGLDEPTIDPMDVERRISDRTKAVVVMHYGGYTCRMAEIKEICSRHRLALIEDACHAVGGRYMHLEGRSPHGKTAGALGDIACFSFFSNKNLATGEGGMVVTNRDDLAERVRLLRSHGMTTLSWERSQGHASRYDVALNGYNYRMDDIRAALGRVQLSKLEQGNARRRELVTIYRQELQMPDWLVPFENHAGISAAHLMVLVAPTEVKRRQAMDNLAHAGIQTSMHYPCLSSFTAFRRHTSAGLDRSIEFGSRALTLPLFPALTVTSVMEICSSLRSPAAFEVGKGGT